MGSLEIRGRNKDHLFVSFSISSLLARVDTHSAMPAHPRTGARTFFKRAINTSETKNSPLRLILFDQSVLLHLLCDRSVSGCVIVVEGEWEVGFEKSAYGLWVVGIRLGM